MRLTKNVKISSTSYQPLPRKILLKGGKVVDPSQKISAEKDILLEGGKIKQLGEINDNSFANAI